MYRTNNKKTQTPHEAHHGQTTKMKTGRERKQKMETGRMGWRERMWVRGGMRICHHQKPRHQDTIGRLWGEMKGMSGQQMTQSRAQCAPQLCVYREREEYLQQKGAGSVLPSAPHLFVKHSDSSGRRKMIQVRNLRSHKAEREGRRNHSPLLLIS